MKTPVSAKGAPAAIGPYSQAVKSNGFVFVSGVIGLDPVSGQLVSSSIEAETQQVMNNLMCVLDAAGVSAENVVKTTIYLKNIKDFPKVNEIYGGCFKSYPARATVEVSDLPAGASVEIEAIASE